MKTLSVQTAPVILVTGATGMQGGSVARALLSENKFRVRILTRNPGSQKSVMLSRAGAEVVQGDMNDISSLKKAMKGVYGVFGVTDYREHYDKEFLLGKNIIDAAKETGIAHLVMHSMPDYNKLSNGKYSVPQYDGKARLEAYARSLDIPSTFLQMGFYYENFLSTFLLQKDHNGGYYFGLPQGNTKMAAVSAEDAGPVVANLFNNPDIAAGKTIMAVGDDKTCDEYAAIMTNVLGKNIYYTYVPANVYAAYDFPGAAELANMFEVQRLYIPSRKKEIEESLELNPRMQSFQSWVEKNRSRFFSYFNSRLEAMVI